MPGKPLARLIGQIPASLLLLALVASGSLGSASVAPALAVAGFAAVFAGAWLKFTLITRAGFNQGFALPHLPVRGVRR